MPPEAPVLVVALSGRAIAASAARAGHRVVVLDAFDDLDTAEHALASARVPVDDRWRFDAALLLELATRLAPPPIGLVYGSGFERAPALLGRLAAGRPLLGNPPERVARVKDPFSFAVVARRLGIPHPEIRATLPADPRGWLIKRAGGAGGSHIRVAEAGAWLRPGDYAQRRVPGRAVGALCLGDGSRARLVGLSEQWTAQNAGGAAFRYAGAAVPAALAPSLAAGIGRAACELVSAFGLVGLASVDVLVEGDGFHVLEINARPGATIDVFDRAQGISLFDLHLRACAGELPEGLPLPRRAEASMVAFATTRHVVPGSLGWPDWIADRPRGGDVIMPRAPICTVFAAGACAEEAKGRALERARTVPRLLDAAGAPSAAATADAAL